MARRTAPAPGQYDLFGEDERAEQEAAVRAKTRAEAEAEWAARFERADWIAAHDTAGGMKAGDRVPGWKCPACGTVEPNEFLLGTNHGYHLHSPGHVPYIAGSSGEGFGETCAKLEIQKNQRIYDERMAMIRHLIDAGLDDEQISAQATGGDWPASMIARDRARFAGEARLAARAAKGEVVKVPHGDRCPCAFCDGPCSCASCQSFRENRL